MATKTVPPRNLHIRPISHRGKSCPCCKAKLDGDTVYSAGEYIRARWNNVVDRFCRKCYQREIPPVLQQFTNRTGRAVAIVGTTEDWMTI